MPPSELLYLIKQKYGRDININHIYSHDEPVKYDAPPVALDEATRVMEEVLKECGARSVLSRNHVADLIEVMREELAENETRTKNKFIRIVTAAVKDGQAAGS